MLQFLATEPLSTRIEVGTHQELEDVLGRLRDAGIPDTDIHAEMLSCPDAEVTDLDFSSSIRLGAFVGLPGLYVVVVIMALLAGTTVTEALWMALLPAVFCGWFFAGFVFLNARVGRVESADHVVHEHEVGEIVVTGVHAGDARALLEGQAAQAA